MWFGERVAGLFAECGEAGASGSLPDIDGAGIGGSSGFGPGMVGGTLGTIGSGSVGFVGDG